MSSVIYTNVSSLKTQSNLASTQMLQANAIEQLSTGLRVNSAADDAAGLAIASRMDEQINGDTVAIRNANDATSLAQTADGALGQVTAMAQQMRQLAVQSANATNSASDRTNLDAEYQQLSQEIQRTLAGTQFNGLAILGADAGAQVYQVGSGTTANDQITVTTTDMTADASVTAVTGGDITSAANATTAMNNIDTMIDKVNSERANYGAAENRFSNVVATLQTDSTNQSAAKSRIMDTDFAAETAALTRAQVLQQAGVAMVAQANAAPNTVLQLLK